MKQNPNASRLTQLPCKILPNIIKAEREDGQLLILSPSDGLAAALSTLPSSLDNKDNAVNLKLSIQCKKAEISLPVRQTIKHGSKADK
jgi:hypothetical protein